MKLLVLGHARHGKDTLCEVLRDNYSFKFTSSSEYCLKNIIMPAIGSDYTSEQECFDDRVNRREEWFNLIRKFNEGDESRLSKAILSENDIYCGMRSKTEFEASKHLFDKIIWVDASNRIPLESFSSFEITESDCHYTVPNNTTKDRFLNIIKSLVICLRGDQT